MMSKFYAKVTAVAFHGFLIIKNIENDTIVYRDNTQFSLKNMIEAFASENDFVDIVHNRDGIIIIKIGKIINRHLIAQLSSDVVLPVNTLVNLPKNIQATVEACTVNFDCPPDEYSVDYFTDFVAFESVGSRHCEDVLKDMNIEKVVYTMMNLKI